MQNYFVIADNHQWAHSTTSAFDAMQSAGIVPMSKAECFAQLAESALTYEPEHVRNMLFEGHDLYASEKQCARAHEFVLIYVSHNWELADVNELNGTPSWKPAKDAESGVEFKEQRLNLLIKPDGTITPR